MPVPSAKTKKLISEISKCELEPMIRLLSIPTQNMVRVVSNKFQRKIIVLLWHTLIANKSYSMRVYKFA